MKALSIALLMYGVASLLHFGHNAEHVHEYPNLPAWLSREGVYAAWLGVTAIGGLGYLLVKGRYTRPGLTFLFAYGFLGFAGLAHYAVAPMSAHSAAMNATIWLEAATALLLLVTLTRHAIRRAR